jgi:hypothetical protein
MKQSQSQSQNNQSQSQSATSGEIAKSDEPVLHSEGTAATERDPSAAVPEEAPSTQPKDAYHDVGSGEEETSDGLDPESEFVRQAAEEGALDEPESDDIPVFDQANRSERM